MAFIACTLKRFTLLGLVGWAFVPAAPANGAGVTIAEDRLGSGNTSSTRIHAGPSGAVYWGSRVYAPGDETPSEWRVLATRPGGDGRFEVIDRYNHGKPGGNQTAWAFLESPRAGVLVGGSGTRADGGQAWVIRRRVPGAFRFATVDDFLPEGAAFCNVSGLVENSEAIYAGGFCLSAGFATGRSILRASHDGGKTWEMVDESPIGPGRVIVSDLLRHGPRGVALVGDETLAGRQRLFVRALPRAGVPAVTLYAGPGPAGEELEGYSGFTGADGHLRVGAWVLVNQVARRVVLFRVEGPGRIHPVSTLTDVSAVLRYARGPHGEVYGAFVDHRPETAARSFVVKVSGDDGATWTELDRYAGERPGGWSGGNGVTVTRSGDVLASAVSFDPTTPENSAERFSSVVRRVTTPGF